MERKELFLSKERIRELLYELDKELGKCGIEGEICIVGGAVMCMVYSARESTTDIDAVFEPKTDIYAAVETIAKRQGLPTDWLNDGVKGFMGEEAQFHEYLNLPNLRVLTALPEYLLAMKCLSARTNPNSQDKKDIGFLLNYLEIKSKEEAIATVTQFYPAHKFPTRALFMIEECLENK